MARHAQPREKAELKGATKKHPDRYRGEPVKNSQPIGNPPDGMGEAAQAVWFELSATALPGVLTGSDRLLFTVLCNLVSEYQQSPVDFAVGKYTHLIGLAGRFGLSPADRQKFVTAKPEQKNPFEDLLN